MGLPTSMKPVPRPLVFALNGQRVVLSSVDPSTTLLSYIRSETRFKGPKRGCGEGGCGACLVMLAKYNPETKEVKESSVNSCLVMLCSIDGCAITTTEGLGNQRDGFHAIQKRLSAFHGSQCGFCTPGMTVAIYNGLKQEQHQHQHSSDTNGHSNSNPTSGPSMETMERAIQGNICRCTGYRPILDVCKSFAFDVDLEDLGLNTCWTDKAQAKPENLPAYDSTADPTFPQFLIDEIDSGKLQVLSGIADPDSETKLEARFTTVDRGEHERSWVSIDSFEELRTSLKFLSSKRDRVKLVVGNTSSGLLKEIGTIDVFVDISQIPELLTLHQSSHSLEIGAATRISELMDHLEDFRSEGGCKHPVAEGLVDHLKKLAGAHVRNWGSVGGNLVMAQQFAFESDLATILLGAGASVKVITLRGSASSVANMPLEDFLAMGSLGEDRLLQSVYIPLDGDSRTTTVFKSFRGAPRPYGNAVSYANSAFLAHVSTEGGVLESVRLAFGAFGTKHAIRAGHVEKLLTGKALSLSLVKEAVEVLKKDVVPSQGSSMKEYRVSLAVGFLFDFLTSLLTKEPVLTPTHLFPHSGKQNVSVTDEQYPLSQPAAKFLSQQQASGEAIYCDDIPSPPHCLYAAFVLSTEPLAKIKRVDTARALESVGVVDYVSISDIPKNGRNAGIFSPYTQATEPLFADDRVFYVGQPVGLVVADTYEHAHSAAGKVRVEYDTQSVGKPVMTCQEAVAQNSTHALISLTPPKVEHPIGDVDKALAEAELKFEGKVSTKSQQHFYMETQTSLVVPDEDGCFTVYTACQGVDLVQLTLASCLGIPLNNIRVITRRLGGGFGGKGFRNILLSSAVALAAYKLQRPVRISLDRNTDMQMIAGRFPTETTFQVGFSPAGKVTALKVDMLMEGGWYPDITGLMAGLITTTLKKYDYGTFDVKFTLCRTNNVPKTSVRAPGDAEGSAVADAILNQVASYLGVSVNQVREANLHTQESITRFHGADVVGGEEGFTLPAIWERVKQSSNLEAREKEVERFNAGSPWIKRGISIVSSVYHVMVIPRAATVSIFQDGSVVAEVAGVEMGQGLHTKVRQAIAFALSPLWNQKKDVDLVSKIRVLQQDSFSLPNAFVDGGSTSSEGTCAAARQACATLVERMLPIKEMLAKDQPDGEVSWETLCFTARNSFIDLQSHTLWAPSRAEYLLFGAGVGEVEINLLSGETRILAADLVYDAGKSLNSAVDVGQVEGAFVFGIGFLVTEDVERDTKGKLLSDGTWTYKPPTLDTIPQKFNVELFKSPAHKDHIFSSKAVGEPPLLLAGCVYSAIHSAIAAARKDYRGANAGRDLFEFNPPATLENVKSLCGFDNVERYIDSTLKRTTKAPHGKLL